MKVERFDHECWGTNIQPLMKCDYGLFVKACDYDALHRLARDLALAVKNTADQLEAAGGPLPTFRALVKEWEALSD